MEMKDIGRDALTIYLKDVLDLETTRALLSNKFNIEQQRVEEARTNLLTPNLVEAPKKKNNGCLVALIIYIVAGTLLCLMAYALQFAAAGAFHVDYSEFGNDLFASMSQIVGLSIVCLLIGYIAYSRKRNSELDASDAAAHNQQEAQRISHNQRVFHAHYEEPWQKLSSELSRAYADTTNVLEENYSLDLVPVQFRNLASIQYIYDYMRSSKLTFEQAIYQAQIDDGIKRLEERLNVIIQQNAEQLHQLYAIRQNTETIMNQNRTILAAQVASAYYSRQTALHARSIERTINNLNYI